MLILLSSHAAKRGTKNVKTKLHIPLRVFHLILGKSQTAANPKTQNIM